MEKDKHNDLIRKRAVLIKIANVREKRLSHLKESIRQLDTQIEELGILANKTEEEEVQK